MFMINGQKNGQNGLKPILLKNGPFPCTQCLSKNGQLNGAAFNGLKDVKCEQGFKVTCQDRVRKQRFYHGNHIKEKRFVTMVLTSKRNVSSNDGLMLFFLTTVRLKSSRLE